MSHHRIDVPLSQASRLLNHGPTVLVTSAHGSARNVMAAAWAMPLDFDPPKVAVVIDKHTYSHQLIAASGSFALQVPRLDQADLTTTVGNSSGQELAKAGTDKFTRYSIAHFAARQVPAPLVADCLAWLECRVIAWPDMTAAHDLYLAEVVSAQADGRVFVQGRWQFDQTEPGLRSLHHLGGGQYVAPGQGLTGRQLG